jgi:hypothetical protein
MSTLVDSYSESNYTTDWYISGDADFSEFIYAGQSFTGNGEKIVSCKFYLQKNGLPTGNCYAKLYSHSGTYGSSSKPGDLLATSDAKDVSTISTSYGLVEFTFSGAEQYTLVNGTYYIIMINYEDGTTWADLNFGVDYTSPSHGGNASHKVAGGSTWIADGLRDACFYVYSEAVSAPPFTPTTAFMTMNKSWGVP